MPSNGPSVRVPVVPGRRVLVEKVHSVLSNRVKNSEEQYLVRWHSSTATSTPPLSWHPLNELVRCLEYVQDYLDDSAQWRSASVSVEKAFRKRKSPDTEPEFERRPSPVDRRLYNASRMSSGSRSSSVTSATPPPVDSVFSPTSVDVYNGVLDSRDGFIFATSADGVTHQIDISNVPTPEMRSTARRSTVSLAEATIRELYRKRLEKVPGKKIHLVNTFDGTTPSLRFRYITDYVLRKGVYRVDPAAQVGCQSCNPRMGRDIGCEYTQKCECLEYAVVDEARLNDEEKARFLQFKNGYGDTVGLPKKFPYFTEGTKKRRAGTLVPFYLNSRRPIYECNESCRCGPLCRNKNVQFGRTIELEIFKTPGDRGWGLRCKEKLYEGQFIDTYRGEIINDAEATRREEEALSKTKASYLYSLDKFAETEGLRDEDIYVVDGQFMGGPTKFMNHSCEPNCRQYTVSYNKHDPKVYDIAFFACRDIPAGEELTFDYLDKEEDEDEEVEQPGASAIPCLCGATKCRKWLWT